MKASRPAPAPAGSSRSAARTRSSHSAMSRAVRTAFGGHRLADRKVRRPRRADCGAAGRSADCARSYRSTPRRWPAPGRIAPPCAIPSAGSPAPGPRPLGARAHAHQHGLDPRRIEAEQSGERRPIAPRRDRANPLRKLWIGLRLGRRHGVVAITHSCSVAGHAGSVVTGGVAGDMAVATAGPLPIRDRRGRSGRTRFGPQRRRIPR